MAFIYFLGTLYIIYQIIKGIGVFFTEIAYLFKRHEIPSSTDVAKKQKEEKSFNPRVNPSLYMDYDDDDYDTYEEEFICNYLWHIFPDEYYYPQCPECYSHDVDLY